MTKILVLGATGYVGSELISSLEYFREFKVFGTSRKESKRGNILEADLAWGGDVSALMHSIRPDVIFCLAAEQRTPHEFENNVLVARNVAEHAPAGCRLVFASSSTVYGNLSQALGTGHPCRESDVLNPTTPYGESKKRSEEIFLGRKDISTVILRFSAITGPNARKGLVKAIYDKLKDLAGNNTSSLKLLSDTQKPFTYIDDIVEALVRSMDLPAAGGIYNCNAWGSLRVSAVAAAMMEMLGVHHPIEWEDKNNFTGDNPLVIMDNTKIKEAGIKFHYKTSMDAIKWTTFLKGGSDGESFSNRLRVYR